MHQSPLIEPKDEVMVIVNNTIQKRKNDPHQVYHLLVQPKSKRAIHPSFTKNGKKVSKFWMDFVGTETALLNKMKTISSDLQQLSPKHYFDIDAYLPPVGKEDSLWRMYSYHGGELTSH